MARTGMAVRSLIEYAPLRTGDIGLIVGPCTDPSVSHNLPYVLTVFHQHNNLQVNLLLGTHCELIPIPDNGHGRDTTQVSQPTTMADIQPPHGAGVIYGVPRGPNFGLHLGDWQVEWQALGACKIEYNERSSRADKRMSGQQARVFALGHLLSHCREPERAAVQTVIDREAQARDAAATEAQKAEAARSEAERAAAARAESNRAIAAKAAAAQAEAEAAARKAAEAAAAKAEQRAEEQAAVQRQMEPTDRAEERSAALEQAYLAVLHRWALERDQPKGARSKAALKRRYAKLKAKRHARAHASGGGSSEGGTLSGDTSSSDATAKLREAELRVKALQRKLESSEALLKAERKRARRDKKTVAHRARQAERSNGKAAARKRKAERQVERRRAERKQDERVRKRQVPTGEPLHSGERKHRRLTDGNGGCN